MTIKQFAVYEALRTLSRRTIGPTLADLAAEAGIASQSTVLKHLAKLEAEGVIRVNRHAHSVKGRYTIIRKAVLAEDLTLADVLLDESVQFVRLASWPVGMSVSADGHFSRLEVLAKGWEAADAPDGPTEAVD